MREKFVLALINLISVPAILSFAVMFLIIYSVINPTASASVASALPLGLGLVSVWSNPPKEKTLSNDFGSQSEEQ